MLYQNDEEVLDVFNSMFWV